MPRAKAGHTQVAVMLTDEVVASLEALAERTGRSFTAELQHAAERHAADPPAVHITTPPLRPVPPIVISPPVATPKKPRQPRKPKASAYLLTDQKQSK
jgi:hypothetical protein